jgi:aspartate/methionine/tyrosine aminotransferase
MSAFLIVRLGRPAFMSVVMTVCDVGDEVIIFTPYYFNHLMALQLINAKVSGASLFNAARSILPNDHTRHTHDMTRHNTLTYDM